MAEIAQAALRLKADMLTFTIVELRTTNLEALAAELEATVSRAPRFFEKAPVVIDVREINANALNLPEFLSVLKGHRIIPIGVKGLNESQEEAAHACGLVCFQSSLAQESAKPVVAAPEPVMVKHPAKIITKPIRAGTTVYAKDQDLIVIASVNVGAECIADGNIHVYGPLRGRALAGASGNPDARIFCEVLEAELVAIAGHYQVRDSLKLPEPSSKMIQVFLKENKLSIETI